MTSWNPFARKPPASQDLVVLAPPVIPFAVTATIMHTLYADLIGIIVDHQPDGRPYLMRVHNVGGGIVATDLAIGAAAHYDWQDGEWREEGTPEIAVIQQMGDDMIRSAFTGDTPPRGDIFAPPPPKV